MTVGKKIKKYRLLKGMTQKELGMKIGFSESTASSRIRKYESDQMAPKMNLRVKLADALDVDISALSDINIRTYEDVMHTFFFLEESYGMEINRSGDSIHLTFDYKDGVNKKLLRYLYSWYSEKKFCFSTNNQDEGRKKYELWKSRFPKDLNSLQDDKSYESENIISEIEKEKRIEGRCILWHEIGPSKFDGIGVFLNEDGSFCVLSIAPSVEKINQLSKYEGEIFLEKYCPSENLEKIKRGDAMLCIYHRSGKTIHWLKEFNKGF